MNMQNFRHLTQEGCNGEVHRGQVAVPMPGHDHTNRYNHKADHDEYDDGLVHGHFWAMSSTVR